IHTYTYIHIYIYIKILHICIFTYTYNHTNVHSNVILTNIHTSYKHPQTPTTTNTAGAEAYSHNYLLQTYIHTYIH
ncbi:hypothetical protein B484DRAFT_314358, partial [Ochromonadaceae sp. CCMP2298]